MNFENISEEAAANYDALAAVDSFDAMADASNFNGPKSVTVVRSSFDISVNNASGEALTVELFNPNRSFAKERNLQYITSATVLMKPIDTVQGQQAAGVGIIGFNQDGNLIATGAVAYTPVLTVSCGQYPYRGVLESCAIQPFRIYGIRMTVTTDAQIDNDITHFNSTFLGAKQQNPVSPRTYFRPDQFQTKIVDIQCDFRIDRERGLYTIVNAGEVVKYTFLIERAALIRGANVS